jgi:hypothetical protein
MTGIGLLIAFILGMVANDFHNTRRWRDRERLEALHAESVKIYVCDKANLDDTLTDVLKGTGAPAPASGIPFGGLPSTFAADLQKNGRARAVRTGSRWKC